MAAGSPLLALLLRLTRGRALTDGLPGLGGVLPGHCSVSDGSNSEKCCGFSKCPTFVSKSTQGWWVGPFRCRVRRRPRPSLSIGRSVSERASERARESQSWRWCQSVEPIKGIINRERVRVSERERVVGPWWRRRGQLLPRRVYPTIRKEGALSLDPGDHVWWMLGRAFDGPL